MDIDVLVDRFRTHYSGKDFRDNWLTEDEYTYKLERGQEMREWLGREVLRDLITQENWEEVGQRVTRSFAMKSGPLARWDEYQWVRELNSEEQKQFVLAFEDYLYGEKPFLERLERFVADATPIYRRFLERDEAHRKKYGMRKLSWPFVSYFHFMMWPDQEYAFVKPTPLGEASKAAGFDIEYDSYPNATTYARVQEFYRWLWPTVQDLGGRDWIDVQTLIHVAGKGFDKQPVVPQPADEPEPISENGWHRLLEGWLRHNPKTMADELWQLRQEFIRRFPKENLDEMTLEQYALGHENYRDSFCYWLEWETEALGSIRGGSSAKFGVWWSKAQDNWTWNKRTYTSPENALARIKEGIRQLLGAVEKGQFDTLDQLGAQSLGPNRYSLRSKPIYLYYPDRFLPISRPRHLRFFLECFGQEPQGDLLALNRQLLEHLRSQSEFEGFDTRQMMQFLYDSFPPDEADVEEPGEMEIEPLEPPALRPILDHIDGSRYIFSHVAVTNYHLSLLSKPFVILTGLSGTGKTKLTRLYADAVYRVSGGGNNPYYAILAVRPDWTDHRGLLGYYNPITRTYETTPFLRFLLKAAADSTHWYYACLDEMNLARVEYYFSDFLSAIESGEAVTLHGYAGQAVATQAGEGIRGRLPEDEVIAQSYWVNDVLYIPSSLHVPPNLVLSGTVNIDETTHAFSDKVLDRANSIEFDHTDLETYAERYRDRFPDRSTLVGEVMPLLGRLYELLEPRYLHFGYRTLDEVLEYLWNNETLPDDERAPRNVALDHQITQKILPKLRGDERIQETLESLSRLLDSEIGAQSQAATKVGWMLEELRAFGSTQFWR